MKLSKTQAELLAAMQGGDTVHFMGYMGSFNPSAYYFLSSSMKRCTAAAEGLRKRGLAERTGKFNDEKLTLTDAGKNWNSERKTGE